jgi:hypothetical protein
MFAPLTMAVIFSGITVVLWLSPVPWLIGAFFGLFAVLPLLVFKLLWTGGGERVWVESGEICVQRVNRPAMRIPGSAVESIEAKHTVGMGTTQFFPC